MYVQSKIRNDSVLSFQKDGHKEFGYAKHYVSFCTVECNSARCVNPCQHVVIVTPYEILRSSWDTTTTGATARHIHRVQLST